MELKALQRLLRDGGWASADDRGDRASIISFHLAHSVNRFRRFLSTYNSDENGKFYANQELSFVTKWVETINMNSDPPRCDGNACFGHREASKAN